MGKDVSIVTGAGRGIGRSIALKLAEEGHNIVILSRTEDELKSVKKEIERFGSESLYFTGDVTDEKFVMRSVKEVFERFNKIDHLINNAGFGIFKKLVDSSLDEFQSQMNTNLFGVYNFCKAVLPGMIERKSGSIINISSLAGKNFFSGGTMYTATKHALMGFSKSLMMEVREYNIRVAVVCPGSVETGFGGNSEMSPVSKSNILLPEDVADTVAAIIKLPVRALISEVELRPTNPKK